MFPGKSVTTLWPIYNRQCAPVSFEYKGHLRTMKFSLLETESKKVAFISDCPLYACPMYPRLVNICKRVNYVKNRSFTDAEKKRNIWEEIAFLGPLSPMPGKKDLSILQNYRGSGPQIDP